MAEDRWRVLEYPRIRLLNACQRIIKLWNLRWFNQRNHKFIDWDFWMLAVSIMGRCRAESENFYWLRFAEGLKVPPHAIWNGVKRPEGLSPRDKMSSICFRHPTHQPIKPSSTDYLAIFTRIRSRTSQHSTKKDSKNISIQVAWGFS